MRRSLVSLVALLGIAVPCAEAQYTDKVEGRKTDVIPGIPTGHAGICSVELSDVVAQPVSYLQTKIAMDLRFHELGEVYQPFFTVFDNWIYVNFSAWHGSADLSMRDEFVADFPLFYADRRNPELMENLDALSRYQRFEIIGRVESIFDKRPFIEVFQIVPLDVEATADQHRRAAFNVQPQPVVQLDAPAAPAVMEPAMEPAPMTESPEPVETTDGMESTVAPGTMKNASIETSTISTPAKTPVVPVVPVPVAPQNATPAPPAPTPAYGTTPETNPWIEWIDGQGAEPPVENGENGENGDESNDAETKDTSAAARRTT